MKRHFARRQSKARTRACRDAGLAGRKLPPVDLPASSHPDVEEEVAQVDPALEAASHPAAPSTPSAIVSIYGHDVEGERRESRDRDKAA